MDIGASCYSLPVEETEGKEDNLSEIVVSCRSLSQYEDRRWKTLVPQITAAAIAASFHIVVGLALAYSAILVPQLESSDDDDDMKATRTETSWIASIIVIVVPIGAISAGFVMDAKGRLNTIRLSTVPVLIGWAVIATADSVTAILAGRVLTGLGVAWFSSPAVVYITEIARPDIRGSLVASAPAFASLGMVLAYLKGWFFSWRTTAWLCNIYVIVSAVFVIFIPESPSWLVSKRRFDEAKTSLEWFNRYQPMPAKEKQKTLSEMQLELLIEDKRKKDEESVRTNSSGMGRTLRALTSKTALKPLLILTGLFFFQNFSGVYVTLFYSVTFFVEMGADVNPYLASVLIGVVRFIMSIANTVLLKKFRRRPLVMISAAGMSVCMLISGLFTLWIKSGRTAQTWVPLLFLLLYVLTSMIGMLPIPWTMTAELFPLEIRGLGHSISYSLANVLMFASLQCYRPLDGLLGGSYGVQWFFTCVAAVSILFTFVFLPETHGKKLNEIQEYFNNNTMFLGGQKAKNKCEDPKMKETFLAQST